jgi:hypothetical protein
MILAAMAVVVLASGCATVVPYATMADGTAADVQNPSTEPDTEEAADAAPETASVDDGSKVALQTIEFQAGVSSVTVERLAKRYGCEGGTGAGLITEKGPVEVYRMNCNNGQVFTARCELRQCQPMQ